MTPRLRLLILLALLLGLYLLGRHLGVTSLSPARLKALLDGAGPAGVLLFFAAFAIGELLHVPGVVFVVVAVLGYGRLLGGGLAYAGALGSLCFGFAVMRGVGGQALAGVGVSRRPILRRLLQHLDERPVRSVIVLRLALFLAPALNTALALSQVRFRDYLLGSALGILPAIIAVTLFCERIARLV